MYEIQRADLPFPITDIWTPVNINYKYHQMYIISISIII